jgi:hypothetical protein
LPDTLRDELALSKRFSLLMEGAARLYNVALARRAQAFREREEEHNAALADWHVRAEEEAVDSWPLSELEAFCSVRANVSPRTMAFVSAWQQLLRRHGSAVAKSAEATSLVEQREWQLKGARSRFRNPHALEKWGGDSGTAPMNYRWGTVRQLLRDLYAGLDRGES